MKRYRLKNLRLTRVDRVPAGSNPESHIVLFKAADEQLTASDATLADTQDPEVSVDEVTETPEEVSAQTEEAPEAQSAEILEDETTPAEAVADEPAAVEPEPELVAASAEPVEDIEKADLRKSLDEARAEIAKMKHDARVTEYVAKAKADFANLGTADEIGGLLLAAADSLPEATYQLLERTLKAANAQVESGDLFKQIGDSAGEPVDPADQITTLAQAMVDAGEAKNLGLAKMEVVKKHPELREALESARRA